MTLSTLLSAFCYQPNEIAVERFSALTFRISFETAQFKKHLIKLYRDTYLMPLPSTVAGIAGAILGIKKSVLKEFACNKELLAGSTMLSYEGMINETMTVMKMKGWREFIRTPKRNVILFRPSYKLALASSDAELIKELERRIRDLDFEFDLFGGNDYNFVSYIGDVKKAKLARTESGYGFFKLSDLRGIEGNGLLQVDEVNDGAATKYAFGYGVKLLVKESLAVQDDEHKILVHWTWRFIR